MLGKYGTKRQDRMRGAFRKFRIWVDWLSGEWILKFHPNGSTIILIRTCWISVILYSAALLLRSLSYTGWPSTVDFGQLGRDIGGTVPWLGAIAGGVYAALYTRFSAQWSYLANVYYQMKEAQVGLKNPDDDQITQIQYWKAAFAEDSEDLHLATKPMFAMTVWTWLQDAGVAEKFDAYTVGGRQRRIELQEKLKNAIREEDPNLQ